ncbi:MAG: hypothetical protein RG741_06470 [Bacteroidales bacterium]|nr:hypothetical protein [Bacteroidales bacterium]
MKAFILCLLGFLAAHNGQAHAGLHNVQEAYHTAGSDLKPLKPFQLSLFPMLGTDGTQSINYRYRTSINMFAGINGGIEGFEMAYFANINLGPVEGLQLAGFGNIVNGSSRGLQLAGFMNVMRGNAGGLRAAGFMNVAGGSKDGLMAAGFMNAIGGNVEGISYAGFGNFYRRDFSGITVAGFMNTTGGEAEGIFVAGFANAYNDVSRGLMLAGFGNFSKDLMQGTQLAGFMNTAGKLQGLQVAGFMNIAGTVEGIQLGFINISDTISGLPIGFLSITRRGGLRQFEMGVSDALIASLSFKIGVPAFYNIFSIGHLPLHDELAWVTGYGIGSHLQLSETNALQIEAHSYQLHRQDKWWDSAFNHHLNELRVLFAYRQNQHVEWFAGPVLYNQRFRDNEALILFDDLRLAPYKLFGRERSDHVSEWWAGARLGVRWILR